MLISHFTWVGRLGSSGSAILVLSQTLLKPRHSSRDADGYRYADGFRNRFPPGVVSDMMRKSWPCLTPCRTHLKVRPLKDAMAASPSRIAIFPRRVERPWRMVNRGRDTVKRWLAAVLAFPGSVPAPKRLLNIETASGSRSRTPNVGLDAPTGSMTRIVDSGVGSAQAWRRRTFHHISF